MSVLSLTTSDIYIAKSAKDASPSVVVFLRCPSEYLFEVEKPFLALLKRIINGERRSVLELDL